MKKLFYRVGLGMIFVIFNIGNTFDLLPDPIGYLIMMSALLELRRLEKSFTMGAWISGVLTVISIPGAFQRFILNVSYPGESLHVGLIFQLAETFLNWALLYSICNGAFKLAAIRGKGDLAAAIRYRWWLYFGSSAFYMLFFPYIFNFDRLNEVVLLAGGISWIAFIMIFMVIRRTGRELAGLHG